MGPFRPGMRKVLEKFVAWARTYPNCDAIVEWEKHIYGRVADMGCNVGVFSLFLAELESVDTVTGIDINDDAFKVFRDLLRTSTGCFPESVRHKIVWPPIHANIVNLATVKNDSFDTVCCFQTFEHLYEKDVEPFLAELKRVLVPGGKCIICIPYDHFHDSGNHKTFWTEISLAVLFNICGFKTIKCSIARMNMIHGLFENTVGSY